MRANLFTFLLFVAGVQGAQSSPQFCYRITGEVAHQEYFINGSLGREYETQFVIDVCGCKWIMRFKQPTSDYTEVSFDGDKTYYFDSMENVVRLKKAVGEAVGDNVGVAIVRKSQVPAFSHAHQAGLIWLTYASGCYFENKTNGIVEPAATLGVMSGHNLIFDQYVTMRGIIADRTTILKVPKNVIYLDDGIDKNSGLKEPKPFENGYTNTLFEIDSITNIDSLAFPLTSVLRTYGVNKVAKKPHLQLLHEYRIQTKSVEKGTMDITFTPAITGLTLFSDERFNTNNSKKDFPYLTNRWLSDEEAMKLPGYQKAETFARYSSVERRKPLPHLNRTRKIISGLIILSFILFGAIAYKLRSK